MPLTLHIRPSGWAKPGSEEPAFVCRARSQKHSGGDEEKPGDLGGIDRLPEKEEGTDQGKERSHIGKNRCMAWAQPVDRRIVHHMSQRGGDQGGGEEN